MRKALPLLLTLVLAGCGGNSHATPTRAEKVRCLAALARLDAVVWVLHQPGDYRTADKACPWIPPNTIIRLTKQGQRRYQANLANH